MVDAYYADDQTTLYHGDLRDVLPRLDVRPDCVVTDPPYGETSLVWDRWPDGWPALVARLAGSMWCFGSMRMFLDRRDDFAAWKLSQDIIWEKHNGTGFAADRFKRVHELATHWYRGDWRDVIHQAQREVYIGAGKSVHRNLPPTHTGHIGPNVYVDDGTRLVSTILRAPSVRYGCHPTEKPVGILTPLIEYACPPGGLVLDPFAGSGSTAEAARLAGRRTVLVEADERYCEAIVRRLAQGVLLED